MSINYTAHLVYGFQISDDKLIQEIEGSEDDFDLDKDLKIIFHGSKYEDQPRSILVCIKKSIRSVDIFEEPRKISMKDMHLQKDWDLRLRAWAKEHNCSKPQINWFLCVNED